MAGSGGPLSAVVGLVVVALKTAVHVGQRALRRSGSGEPRGDHVICQLGDRALAGGAVAPPRKVHPDAQWWTADHREVDMGEWAHRRGEHVPFGGPAVERRGDTRQADHLGSPPPRRRGPTQGTPPLRATTARRSTRVLTVLASARSLRVGGERPGSSGIVHSAGSARWLGARCAERGSGGRRHRFRAGT